MLRNLITTAKLQKEIKYSAGRCVAVMSVRDVHSTAPDMKSVTARYKVTRDRTKPLTYEMAYKPHEIAHTKSWNSWNTSNLIDGKRRDDSLIDDVFIRKFLTGTWHNLFVSEIIIKRQYNIIRIAGIIQQKMIPRKMYFLIGYSEELLSYWLRCPVKLELQTVPDKKDVVYKYI